jgi:hypothetical protein
MLNLSRDIRLTNCNKLTAEIITITFLTNRIDQSKPQTGSPRHNQERSSLRRRSAWRPMAHHVEER